MIKIRIFIKKVIYSIGANFLNLFVSVLTTLVVPKFLGENIEQYGYLQIYLFYIAYLGFFHLGWCDGIFLRDGGKNYEELNKSLYSSQFWLFSLFELIVSLCILIVGYVYFPNESEYLFICWAIVLNIIVYLPRTMLQYFLQTTNRIKEYASITIVGRSIYGILIIVIILCFTKNYRWFVIGDILGKTVALIIAFGWCKDIVLTKPCKPTIGIKEGIINISVGIKLMFANIASMLITGIVRWGIQQQWDIVTYGRISLTLSVSNLILTFISAIALVLYPTLKKIGREVLPKVYKILQDTLMVLLFGSLMLYYPLVVILTVWLPQYAESIKYMAILFPMCIFAAKMTLLVQTFMNVLRLEKQIMRINCIGVIVAAITMQISVFWMESLPLAMGSIVFNQFFRCIYAEKILSPYINLDLTKESLIEMIIALLFIIANWFIGGTLGFGLYIGVYIAYLIYKRKNILTFIGQIKRYQGR